MRASCGLLQPYRAGWSRDDKDYTATSLVNTIPKYIRLIITSSPNNSAAVAHIAAQDALSKVDVSFSPLWNGVQVALGPWLASFVDAR